LDEEQFGFRRGRGCTDALHILRMVVEKSEEWGKELWIAALDVEKAFDKVHHSDLFASLMHSGVDSNIVAALMKLYCDLQAYVVLWPGAESRTFDIHRGVRQGDPLSPLLFNLVLNGVLAEVGVVWQRRGYGTDVGRSIDGKRLTHVAFADDVSIVAKNWISLKRMVLSLRAALAKRGLRLHPAKCKAQTNTASNIRRGAVQLDDEFTLEVLPEGAGLKILGTILTLTDVSANALEHRVAAGWKSFWSMKRLLLNRKISLRRRLRLFDRTVSSCVLWGCQSWTPRVGELRSLEVTRRAMLRRIVHSGRAPEEEWIEWIRRVTQKAIELARTSGVRDWVKAHAASKWSWAGHVMWRPATSWVWRVTTWRDSDWNNLMSEFGGNRLVRPSRRRYMKWEYSLWCYCATQGIGNWKAHAADRNAWHKEVERFAVHSSHEYSFIFNFYTAEVSRPHWTFLRGLTSTTLPLCHLGE
jgi:hypothetical protein